MEAFYFFSFVSISMLLFPATASHFLGANFGWEALVNHDDNNEEYPYKLHLRFSAVWRMSEKNELLCGADTVADQNSIGDSSQVLRCVQGCQDHWQQEIQMLFPCADFSIEGDWSRTMSRDPVVFYLHKNTTQVTTKFTYNGCCWTNTAIGGGKWFAISELNLGIRSDVLRPNSSPVTDTSPVLKFKLGCSGYVDLVKFDKDDDKIQCRFAYKEEECGTQCEQYKHFKLIEETCRLSYNGGGTAGLKTVKLIIEDFLLRSVKMNSEPDFISKEVPLSSIASLFVIEIVDDGETTIDCRKPEIIDFANGYQASVVVGSDFTTYFKVKTFKASVSSVSASITGPPGVSSTVTFKTEQEDDVITSDVNLSWSDITADWIGPNIICVIMTDSDGIDSEQHCVIVNVGSQSNPCDINNGGCSDVCNPISSASYTCHCSRPCGWKLGTDRRTCYPELEVECLTDSSKFTLKVCAVDSKSITVGGDVNAGKDECDAQVINETWVSEFAYDSCSTVRREDFYQIYYTNIITISLDDEEGSGGAITRKWYSNIEIMCSYYKYGNLGSFFTPKYNNDKVITVPGLGSFTFVFDFFENENFVTAYSSLDVPIVKEVNSIIYFALGAQGGDEGLVLHTERCIATPTETTDEATLSYTIIDNGCLMDETMQKYDSGDSMKNYFSISAFRFRKEMLQPSDSDNVYIQCLVLVCVEGDDTTKCASGCRPPESENTRKRREADTHRNKREEDGVLESEVVRVYSLVPITVPQNVSDYLKKFLNSSDIVILPGEPNVNVEDEQEVEVEGPTSKEETTVTHSTTKVPRKSLSSSTTKKPDKILEFSIAVVGIGVAAFIIILCVIGAILFCYCAKKKTKIRRCVTPAQEEIITDSYEDNNVYYMDESSCPRYSSSWLHNPNIKNNVWSSTDNLVD